MTWQELSQQIDQAFSLSELEGLAFALNIDFDHITGQTKPEKIRGLLLYCQRRNRIPDLLNELNKLRPGYNWSLSTPNVHANTQDSPQQPTLRPTPAQEVTSRQKPLFNGWSRKALLSGGAVALLLLATFLIQRSYNTPFADLIARLRPSEALLSDVLTGETALKLIYGDETEVLLTPDGKYTYTTRQINELESQLYDFTWSTLEDGQVYTKVAAMIRMSYQTKPYQEYLVLTETAPPNFACHACSPAVSGAIISNQNGRWQVVASNEAFTHIGDWGELPPIRATEVGADRYGALLESEHGGMGFQYKFIHLIEFIDYYRIEEVLKLPTYISNTDSIQCTNDGKCYEYNATIEFIKDPQAKYYDIQVHRWGTDIRNDEVVPIDETELYRFYGNVYEPVTEIER